MTERAHKRVCCNFTRFVPRKFSITYLQPFLKKIVRMLAETLHMTCTLRTLTLVCFCFFFSWIVSARPYLCQLVWLKKTLLHMYINVLLEFVQKNCDNNTTRKERKKKGRGKKRFLTAIVRQRMTSEWRKYKRYRNKTHQFCYKSKDETKCLEQEKCGWKWSPEA